MEIIGDGSPSRTCGKDTETCEGPGAGTRGLPALSMRDALAVPGLQLLRSGRGVMTHMPMLLHLHTLPEHGNIHSHRKPRGPSWVAGRGKCIPSLSLPLFLSPVYLCVSLGELIKLHHLSRVSQAVCNCAARFDLGCDHSVQPQSQVRIEVPNTFFFFKYNYKNKIKDCGLNSKLEVVKRNPLV